MAWPDGAAANDQGQDGRDQRADGQDQGNDSQQHCPVVGFSPPVEVTQISSTSDDWSPYLAADGLSVVFTSWRKDGGKGEGDIWISTRSDTTAAFSKPTPIDEINTANNEGGPVLSFDGRR